MPLLLVASSANENRSKQKGMFDKSIIKCLIQFSKAVSKPVNKPAALALSSKKVWAARPGDGHVVKF